MKTTLITYLNGLSDLRHYLDGVELEAKVLSTGIRCRKKQDCRTHVSSLQEHWRTSHIKRRRFNYNSIIVSLYGYLEQYVENLICEVAKSINKFAPTYSNLPSQLQANHLRLSLDLLKNVRFKDKFTVEKIIENLDGCVNGKATFFLNYLAFAQHTANFRKEIINENFRYLCFEQVCEKALSQSKFLDYLGKVFPERNPASIKADEALFYLQDLADRRNQVAHGVLPDELLSTELLVAYIDFFEVFGQALYQVCQMEVLSYIVEFQSSPIGAPLETYRGGEVICLVISNISLKVTDALIACTKEGQVVSAGFIEEIQLNGKNVEEVTAVDGIEVGLRLSFKVRKNYSLFISRHTLTHHLPI